MSDRPIDDPIEPEIGDPTEPEIVEVRAANQAFYDAHERRDIDAMRTVWEHSDRVVCTHPGWPILRTWPAVEESWRRILAGLRGCCGVPGWWSRGWRGTSRRSGRGS